MAKEELKKVGDHYRIKLDVSDWSEEDIRMLKAQKDPSKSIIKLLHDYVKKHGFKDVAKD